MTLDEEKLVKILSDRLEESGHLTFQELTLTRSLLDMTTLSDSSTQKRIDLAGLNKYDGQVLFFEAEREFTVKHPLTYRSFCDFCYMLAPAAAYQELPKALREEQIAWAEKEGLGIVLVEENEQFQIIVSAQRNLLSSEVRTAVRSIMRTQDPLSSLYPPVPHFAR